MILVTGAAGKTGRAVVKAVAERGLPVRALVFREDQAEGLRRLGADQAVVGDMRAPLDLDRAVEGVRAVYHICPNLHPDEIAIGRMAISVASEAGVERFVYHSVLLPAVRDMPHHWLKHRVEQLLPASGLRYTVLQPCAYMQNVLAGWDSIARRGVFRVPYGVDTAMSLVDLADVGAAAAEVLAVAGTGHDGATYELCGPEPVSPADVAAAFSRSLGSPVRAEAVDVAIWEAGARDAGLGEYQIDALVRMFEYYDRHGFVGDPGPLADLLERAPTRLERFVERACRAAARSGS